MVGNTFVTELVRSINNLYDKRQDRLSGTVLNHLFLRLSEANSLKTRISCLFF
jgi:hypothetical protein